MASNSRDLVVNLVGNTAGLTGPFSRLGSFMTGPGGLAAIVGAGAIAAGVGLVRLGESFDEAFDAIRVGTGASGGELDDLQQSFKNVFSSVPTDMESASTAITGLNQRLHLTGQPLEDLSAQLINLSRITGTDLASNIESSTRLFGDWGVATDDMAGTLDEMFRASQASGVGVDVLADSMVRFGAPLRQLGFGFEESLALFAKFEAEGVNTSQVMTGMRTGLSNLAKAGEDAPATFRRIVDEIAAMEDPTAATALAIELFGSRAGPDLAAAIREGRFEIDDYLATIEGGEDTINSAAGATDDWREKLKLFGNKMMVAFEPLATKLFDGLGRAMDALGPVMEDFGVWLGVNLPKASKKLGEAFQWLRTNVIAPLSQMWQEHGDKIKRFVTEVFGFAVQGMRRFADDIKHLIQLVKSVFEGDWSAVWEHAKAIFVNAWEQITAFAVTFGPRILDGLGDLGGLLVDKGAELLNGLWQGTQKEWDDRILPWIKDLPGLALEGLGMLGELLVAKGKELLGGLWQGIQAVWDDPILPWLKDLPNKALVAVPAMFKTISSRGKQLLNGLMNGVRDVWNGTVKPWLADLPNKALVAVPAMFQTIVSRGKQLLNGLMNGVRDVWNGTVKPWLGDIANKALLAVPAMFETITSRGKQLMNGLMNGVKDVWNGTVQPWLAGLGTKALLAVPALYDTIQSRGKQLMNGMLNGIKEVWGNIGSWLGGIPGRISGFFSNAGSWLVGAGRAIISGLWNGFINGVNSMIPGWARGFLGIGGAAVSIPGTLTIGGSFPGSSGGNSQNAPLKFHDGGVVPGPLGKEVLAILQAGEQVLPFGSGAAVSGGGDTYITINMPPGSNGDDVVRSLKVYERRNGPIPIKTRAS